MIPFNPKICWLRNTVKESFGTRSEEEHCITERREKKIANNDFNELHAQISIFPNFQRGKPTAL